jgi:FAD/FMN-containing dehydrogenase
MLIDELKEIVGPAGWTTDAKMLVPHLTEWRDTWTGATPIMVSPDSTDKVAAVVRACGAANTAVVPQGGNTGLCGGAIPGRDGDQVLLSLARMNRIRLINETDFSLIAEAGCTLASIQDAAAKRQRFFPLSLAAEGSCQIGGNLSTNAGGINVLRYGTARDQALGLEVVLADGTIWNGLRALRKDTAGYDLKQLFIGSEGTLGIITAACLRLYPAVRNPETALVAVATPAAAVELFAAMRSEASDKLQAFELIPDRAVQFVLNHIPGMHFPLLEEAPWYVLLEASDMPANDQFEQLLMVMHARGLVLNAIVTKSRSEADELWRFRHAISEAQKRAGASLKHDVSVPVGEVANFIAAAEAAVAGILPGIRPVPFGHIGDGNIHFNLSQPENSDAEAFLAQRESLATAVYDVVASFGGSISAEHGIGQAKREQLERYRGPIETNLMRKLKLALDPASILNPGKVI